jgi:hypothetical protein
MAENFLVHMKLRPDAQSSFRYDFYEAPDLVSNDAFPGGGVKPQNLLINMSPDNEGRWYVSMLVVGGLPVVDGQVKQRKRLINIPFMDPLGEDGELLPPWLKEIAEHHVLLMNDGSPELRERQQEAARKEAREMLAALIPDSTNMADAVAATILAAIRRVG